jgi:prolyl oligopeptidase
MFAASLAAVAMIATAATPRPPETRRGDVVDDYFGTRIPDPYRWLEDDRSPETEAWVRAQNEVTRAFLDAVPGRDRIRARLTELWNYERYTPPVKRGGRLFYTRNSGLQDQAVLLVADGSDAPPRVLLDPNALSADGTVALASYVPSEDGTLLAYALQEAGSDWISWRVRDVRTGADRPDLLRFAKWGGASWLLDGSGFFYSRFPAPAEGAERTQVTRNQQIWFHRLGTAQAEDRLVYERPDRPDWYLGAEVTEDGRLLVVTAWKGTNPESAVFVADLADPAWQPRPLLERMDASYQVVGNDGDVLYVLTNQGAPRRRVVAIARATPEPARWRTVIPEGRGRDVLDAVAHVGGRLVATWMRDARSAVEVWSTAGKRLHAVKLPDLGSAGAVSGRASDAEAFFTFTGFTHPASVERLDAASGARTTWRAPRVAFDPAGFVTEQVFFASKDGTKVPMFLVHRKGLPRDGRAPALLYGYGGFDVSMTPFFSASVLAWLELGGVFALPNLRGGGEYGHAWYDAGRLARKQNTFDDCIAAAEWLARSRVASPARLAVNGGSNGGLLVGAVMTQRPDLFAAAVPEVGVLDMLRFHRFTVGWGWTSDYGSADTKEGFETLIRYSPLHAIRPGTRYPATLVLTADHDDRVVPAHSHKFTAALQAAQPPDGPPILTRIQTRAGHGAGTPTRVKIEERADVLAFLVRVLGVEVPPRASGGAIPAGGAQ